MRVSAALSVLSPVLLMAATASALPFSWSWSRSSSSSSSEDASGVQVGDVRLDAAAYASSDNNSAGNGDGDGKLHLTVPRQWAQVQERNVGDVETRQEEVLRSRSGIAEDALRHYGPPPAECEADETAFQINGIPGAVCSAKCTDFMPCPTDVPAGVTATPMCALENQQTGDKYCVLICNPDDNANLRGGRSGDGECGDATCQPIQGLGVCTYE